MSTCCECTPTYTWLFGSDEMTLRRTSTPVPGGKSCSCESFSSSEDKLLYHSWVDGLLRGSTLASTLKSCEGDSLDRLWDDDTPTSLNTGSGLHPADLARSAAATTRTKSPNVLAPILPAAVEGPGYENFPVNGACPAGYAVEPEAAVFGNLPGNELVASDYANCPSPGMSPVPGFLLIGANMAPGHASTGMNYPAIPAHAAIVPVPVGANYAIAPCSVNFAVPAPVPIGLIVASGPAPVPAGGNLGVGSAPAVNLPAHYDPYPVGLGNFSPYQVLVHPFPTPSCNTTLYCNFFLGCSPNGTCCSQPKTPLNGYV